ncbi:LOW QUALITY PROTEIN: glucan endo-1,3-beta-glucosidase 12 [Arachis duranensis]|uniref:LOW QUALITY PROTEIN: glucan endo-1,3-beta-glucosidase 12 n=1 Tax=Arachis duranensis TaxID=130453 RepID=A0A6P4DTW4_ARADU|nr:LOW QUALITY PROTEIN: glucan endo-1,3-beta-glucosidase 12 [Arachis duranensis]
MEKSVNYFLLLLVLLQFLFSGTTSRTMKEEAARHVNSIRQEIKQLISTSTTKRDITTPITTIPNLFPTSPILNPNSDPDTNYSPSSTTTIIPGIGSTNTPPTSNSTVVPSPSGSSWCIANPSASIRALQVALDYACGYGGTDCSAIQPGGSCYNPNTIRDHASYAFNKYYQKNPVPNSCNFGGTALVTSTNPNSGTCQYPSTSTSSSILNTTNTSGANVFGSVPVPTDPSASGGVTTSNSFLEICLIIWTIISILENNNFSNMYERHNLFFFYL